MFRERRKKEEAARVAEKGYDTGLRHKCECNQIYRSRLAVRLCRGRAHAKLSEEPLTRSPTPGPGKMCERCKGDGFIAFTLDGASLETDQ